MSTQILYFHQATFILNWWIVVWCAYGAVRMLILGIGMSKNLSVKKPSASTQSTTHQPSEPPATDTPPAQQH